MGVRRILLFVTDLEIGGTPTVVRELAIHLNSPPGVEIEVACLKGWGPVADQIKAAGINVSAFGMRRGWQVRSAARRLGELVRERKIDTVFSFLVHANVVAALAARKLPEVRFLQSIQTIQSRPRWHWWAQRWAHRRAERIVVPSNDIVRVAGWRSRIPAAKCVVIPNAIDPDAFPGVEVFGGKTIRAGYLGRLDRAKNYGMLVNALEAARMEEAELHYFGAGDDPTSLERGAGKLGLRVYFHGAVARPQDALAQMDVLWMPSWIEGFGLVIIEAMASGVPVVACNGGGVGDIIRNEENGILVDDVALGYQQFAQSLRLLRDNPDLRRKLIENGLRTVRERFTWDIVLPQYKALLDL